MSGIENNDYSQIIKLGRRGEKIDLSLLQEGITKNDKNKSIFDKFDADKDGKLNKEEVEVLKAYILNRAGEDSILSGREVKQAGQFGKKRADVKNFYAALNDMYSQQLNVPKEDSIIIDKPVVETPVEEEAPPVQEEPSIEEIPPAPIEHDEPIIEPENKTHQYKVNSKETWYGIVQAKYGITDHKQTMEIVRQLKAQNNVDPKATNMPSEITLPDIVTLKDGTKIGLSDINAAVDQSHYGYKTTSETGRYTITQNGETHYYAADGTELKQSYFEAKEASPDKYKMSENGSGRYSYTAENGETWYFESNGTAITEDYFNRREAEYSVVNTQQETVQDARNAFEQQQAEDGWAGKTADAVSVLWNSDNRAVKVEEDLRTYENQIKELQKAQSQGAASFNAKFKEMFGVDYNPDNVAAYVANPTEENYRKAYGTKNDIHKRVMDYNISQQTGAEVVKGVTTVAAGVAIGVATGGVGLAALGTAAAATTAASFAINASDRVSSDVGLQEGELTEIAKGSAIDGASVLAGGMIGKVATTAVKGASIASTMTRATINAAGDVAVGAGTEYMQTGEVSVEGTLINTAMAGVGFTAESGVLKNVANKVRNKGRSVNNPDIPKSGNLNGRDPLADGEVARNIDQSHLDANQRRMVDEALEDVPTPEELDAYSKDIAYQSPTPEERAALDVHQAQVRKDYAEAHRIENNAIVKEQNTPPVVKTDAAKLNDEIKGLDGSIKRLEQQIAGAKRFGKDTSKLESQLANLQAQRKVKADELNALETPDVSSDEIEVNSSDNLEIKANDIPERVPTQEEKMQMGQIGNNINGARTFADLDKAQAWLDKMPECQQKNRLAAQLENKRQQIVDSNNVDIVDAVLDYSKVNPGTKFPKDSPVLISGNETLKLADYDLDLSSPQIKSKLDAMNEGDIITVGREGDIKIDSEYSKVSRKHLTIEKTSNGYIVRDTSVNGTSIGQKMQDAGAVSYHTPVEQSQKFNQTHRVDVGEVVMDGYKDGGRGLRFDSNGNPINTPTREIIVLDRGKDTKLQSIISDVKNKTAGMSDKEKAAFLQKYVHNLTGDGNIAAKNGSSWDRAHVGQEVLLGDIVTNNPPVAVCRHRSLLFKVLGDEIGLDIELQRGNFYDSYSGDGGGHAWNTVRFKDGTSAIYDAMHNRTSSTTPGRVDDYSRQYYSVKDQALYLDGLAPVQSAVKSADPL